MGLGSSMVFVDTDEVLPLAACVLVCRLVVVVLKRRVELVVEFALGPSVGSAGLDELPKWNVRVAVALVFNPMSGTVGRNVVVLLANLAVGVVEYTIDVLFDFAIGVADDGCWTDVLLLNLAVGIVDVEFLNRVVEVVEDASDVLLDLTVGTIGLDTDVEFLNREVDAVECSSDVLLDLIVDIVDWKTDVELLDREVGVVACSIDVLLDMTVDPVG